MKNKKFTYLLGFLVLIVWGIIIYRIIDSATGSETGTSVIESKITKEPFNDYTISKDTTHLLLNYKDPFGLKKQKDTIRTIGKKSFAPKIASNIAKPLLNWSFIKYSGYIRNPGSKKLVAVVNINGKAIMMLEGETAEQVKLIKNLQDSIKVSFNGKTAFIKML
ncbi:hypothetical protein [Mucilaginibacter sp. UR6-11]|uniref:hypothetical protein n=1 Tax=Mucilaginibacter sp. UR6-11 TaxID=1435644 RepID=UPI001E5EF696|nr:hypothetical protein [Mucilaginibacter sp. UR6-11]MCC8427248.1 hypothetical protein [Mucilaginibacter sp. UR6-11]